MQRRGFLKMFGLGVPAAAAALSLSHLIPETDKGYEYQFRNFKPLPEDTIDPQAGWVSYKFHFTVSHPPDRCYRLRYVS